VAVVLMPIPDLDFDPTEVAVSWKVLGHAGHQVRFATPQGRAGRGDDLMVTGRGLDPWGFVPGLSHIVGVGRILRADARGRTAYGEMLQSEEFAHPLLWDDIDVKEFDGLILPGGHRARGMGSYLESPVLQHVVTQAFHRQLPVAAVCHGVLLAARSTDPETGHSVLYGRRTTGLTWSLERRAWHVARVTRFWDPDYYRTYPEQSGEPAGFRSVQEEVTRSLARESDFVDVDPDQSDASLKMSGRARDSPDDDRPAFVVADGNYLSARWPGDVHTFARRFAALVDANRSPDHDRAPGHR
jgi:putative intracellular protease/amidase